MKKIFLSAGLLFFLLLVFFTPILANAACTGPNGEKGLIDCGCSPTGDDACTICDFFSTLVKIYDFIVKMIATPLAIIALTIGGVLIMISAGNPTLMSKGKTIFWSAVIGLVLVFCSYLIIATVLGILGYVNADGWASLNMNCPR